MPREMAQSLEPEDQKMRVEQGGGVDPLHDAPTSGEQVGGDRQSTGRKNRQHDKKSLEQLNEEKVDWYD